METDRQMGKQKDRETRRQIDRQRDMDTDRQAGRQREMETDRQTPAFFAIPLEKLELLGQFSVCTKPQLLGQWWSHVRQSCLLT